MTVTHTASGLGQEVDSLRASMAAGLDREEAIHRMRRLGLNQIACIKLLRDGLGMPLGDAKVAVHCSQAWQDRRSSNEGLHDVAFAAAEERELVEEAGA